VLLLSSKAPLRALPVSSLALYADKQVEQAEAVFRAQGHDANVNPLRQVNTRPPPEHPVAQTSACLRVQSQEGARSGAVPVGPASAKVDTRGAARNAMSRRGPAIATRVRGKAAAEVAFVEGHAQIGATISYTPAQAQALSVSRAATSLGPCPPETWGRGLCCGGTTTWDGCGERIAQVEIPGYPYPPHGGFGAPGALGSAWPAARKIASWNTVHEPQAWHASGASGSAGQHSMATAPAWGREGAQRGHDAVMGAWEGGGDRDDVGRREEGDKVEEAYREEEAFWQQRQQALSAFDHDLLHVCNLLLVWLIARLACAYARAVSCTRATVSKSHVCLRACVCIPSEYS
jgi:hypothetical protein